MKTRYFSRDTVCSTNLCKSLLDTLLHICRQIPRKWKDIFLRFGMGSGDMVLFLLQHSKRKLEKKREHIKAITRW